MFSFSILDPRSIPAATAANDAIFAAGPVYGVEVTVPALAARCVTNLDPQHSGGDASRAAIEDAITAQLPSEGTTLATVRADLDAVGSMAVFSLRAKGESLEPAMERIAMIASADKFARGGYSGPKSLPTADNPWPEESASAEGSRSLAAIAAAVMDFRVPLADRVALMEAWLLTGHEPAQYRAAVERERLDLIRALDGGEISVGLAADGRIAVVESTHRAATMVGYALAPVVVARNPAFRVGGGEPHTKFTVCVFEAGKFADIKSVLAELATIEPGWGGSPTIGGSPQGVSSLLTTEQVVEVVARHLK